jgi:hypothetical protein
VVLSRTGVDVMSEQYFTRPNVQPVITNIGTTPEQRQMSTSEFKAKFDEMPEAIQQYIKETLLTELDAFKQDFMTHQADYASESNAGHIKLPESWTDLTLQNDWDAAGSYARVFKDPFGIVYLEIYASGGVSAAGTTVTNLPAEFRPDTTKILEINSGLMSVEPDGRVRFAGNHSGLSILVLNAVLRAGV